MKEFRIEQYSRKIMLWWIAIAVALLAYAVYLRLVGERIWGGFFSLLGGSFIFVFGYFDQKRKKYTLDEDGIFQSNFGEKFTINAKDIKRIEQTDKRRYVIRRVSDNMFFAIYPQNPQALISALKQFNPTIELQKF